MCPLQHVCHRFATTGLGEDSRSGQWFETQSKPCKGEPSMALQAPNPFRPLLYLAASLPSTGHYMTACSLPPRTTEASSRKQAGFIWFHPLTQGCWLLRHMQWVFHLLNTGPTLPRPP